MSNIESDNNKKTLLNKIINVVLWIILLIWIGFCIIDFYRTQEEKKPIFCVKKETTSYSDGKVDSCTGLGYKIYHYKRKSFNGIEYGPIWSKDRSNKESN